MAAAAAGAGGELQAAFGNGERCGDVGAEGSGASWWWEAGRERRAAAARAGEPSREAPRPGRGASSVANNRRLERRCRGRCFGGLSL